MSRFDDLEHDQLDALAELTTALDINAGVRDLLFELDEAQDVDMVADALDLDTGTAAALAAAGLPDLRDAGAADTPGSRRVQEDAAAEPWRPKNGTASGRRIRLLVWLSSGRRYLARLLTSLAAIFRNRSSRSVDSSCTDRTSGPQVWIAEGPVRDGVATFSFRRSPEPRDTPARTLVEISDEIADLLVVLDTIYYARGRGAHTAPPDGYLSAIDYARLQLRQTQQGLSEKRISLAGALEGIHEAKGAVELVYAERAVTAWKALGKYRIALLVPLIAFALVSVSTDWFGDSLSSVSVTGGIAGFIMVCAGEFLELRRGRHRRTAAAEVERENVLPRLNRLRYDIRRLFDDADEFSRERATHL